MSYGKKCNIIFIRKVGNRLHELEEKYKDLPHQKRAEEINKQLLHDFCVEERQIQHWKRIVETADNLTENVFGEQIVQQVRPSNLFEIAKLPKEKQVEVAQKIVTEKLTTRQTKALVRQALGKDQFNPQLYNVWNFASCDPRFGDEHFEGRIPGQIVQNVLHYFTVEGDLVVDPMSGSGTTFDVCKVMNRRALCYDAMPLRSEIKANDIRQGYPPETQDCNLVFLDPPYLNMVFNHYTDVDEFYSFLKKLAEDTHKILRQNGHTAFLMEDMTEKGNYCLSGESYRIFRDAGFECVTHVSCPLSTEQFNAQQVEKAKREKRMLGRNRDLYIFRR